MDNRLDSISKFSPGNCTHELLEAVLVAQHDLVNRLERSVIDSVLNDSKHNCLIVGPRGIGKTHILAILYNRIRKNKDIGDKVVVGYLKEEERGVATFLDWIRKILESFVRWYPEAKYLEEELSHLTEMSLNAAEKKAVRLLIDFVGDRTLALIVEGLSQIFSEKHGMGKKGQRKFRDIVQEYPFWSIMASSQALFEDIQKEDAPFYGFFKVYHLKNISVAEAKELLTKIASYKKNDRFLKFVDSPMGKGMIRAVHEITGGNPRLFVIFYEFINHEALSEITNSFEKMADDLTPFYQERMNSLPAQQQKILEFLCEHRTPAIVKTIARSCFITHQTALSQLKKLLDLRYVHSTQIGRESFYELSEPLFRICFEVKENRGKPIKLFIDFLGKFYTAEEIKKGHEKYKILHSLYQSIEDRTRLAEISEEIEYYKMTMEKYFEIKEPGKEEIFTQKGRSTHELIEDLMKLGAYKEIIKFSDLISEKPDEFVMEKSLEAIKKTGDWNKALEKAEELLTKDSSNIKALLLKAEALLNLEKFNDARDCYLEAIKTESDNLESLLGLAISYAQLEDYDKALSYTEKMLSRGKKKAFVQLGSDLAKKWDLVKGWEGKEAVQLKSDLAEAKSGLAELKLSFAKGWEALGIVRANLKQFDSARASYKEAIELEPENYEYWLRLGDLEGNQGNHEETLRCLGKVTQLKPDLAKGWRALGVAQKDLKQFDSARVSYNKAIELEPENASIYNMMWAGLEQEAGNYNLALELIDKALSLNKEMKGLQNTKGEILRKLKRFKESIECYQQAIAINPDSFYPYFNIPLAYFQSGNFDEGFNELEKTIKVSIEKKWQDEVSICFEEINIYLLKYLSFILLEDVVKKELEMCDKYEFSEPFSTGFGNALMEILKRHKEVELERMKKIVSINENLFSQLDSFSVSSKLFEIGTSFLETLGIQM